jgi:tetratricopeptide (TPR) repeat protein
VLSFQGSIASWRTVQHTSSLIADPIAVVLWSMSRSLRALGRIQEALSAAQEAQPLVREMLPKGDRRMRLLNAMNLLEILCNTVDIGTEQQIVDAGLAAVQPLREQVTEGNFAEKLIATINITAGSLTKLGRATDALSLQSEAVDLLRLRVEAGTDHERLRLACHLGYQAVLHAMLDQFSEAIARAEECRTLIGVLSLEANLESVVKLADYLHRLGALLSKSDRRCDALVWRETGIDLRRHVTATSPDQAYALGRDLNGYAWTLCTSGRSEDALAYAQEAVALQQESGVETANRKVHFAAALHTLATALVACERTSEALPLCVEAVELVRALPEHVIAESASTLEACEQLLDRLNGTASSEQV